MRKFIGMMTVLVAAALVIGCASSPEKEAAKKRAAALEALKPIQSIPEKRPDWVDSVPITKTELAFVGVSDQYATDAEARNAAQNNARNQLVHYYGTLMSDKGRTAKASYGITSDVFDPQIASQELEEYLSEGIAKQIAAKEFYTEVYLTTDTKYAYKVYALLPIEKKIADAAIKEYLQNAADAYKAQAAAERDAEKRMQFEKASDFFGGTLQTSLFE
ncbi:hypothetical protein [uncultured Treponema sp.]|uniref:hypothetical protein n=1 Tax=uncultured Treponema sp. TaxID=162155 RepID=UPI0028046BF5|nr:hypothetical protein [uncultured Treponema sp.]